MLQALRAPFFFALPLFILHLQNAPRIEHIHAPTYTTDPDYHTSLELLSQKKSEIVSHLSS